LFLAAYILSQIGFKYLFPEKSDETGIFLRPAAESVTQGGNPAVVVENKTSAPIAVQSQCPRPIVDVFFVENAGSTEEKVRPLTGTGTTAPCEEIPDIPAGESATVTLAPWKYSLFQQNGIYELRLPASRISVTAQSNTGSSTLTQGTGATVSSTLTARLEMREPGVFTQSFRTFVSKPLLNLMIFIAGLLPGHNLGLTIIILTILVKLLLFWPTQKSLEGQKKMQILQPKIEALKKQYPNDPKRQQEETMKLWKEHKINPFSACLPTLLQFPILIGLFYAIQEGAHIELSRHLLYSFHQNLPWQFDTSLLGLNLLKPEIYVLPLTLVLLQFLQMKLAFSIAKRKSDAGKAVIDVSKDKPKEMSPQDIQQKVMLYALPLMIGVFAFRFPAAVALYWGVSTLFGIGQQLIVNREHLKV
jgi:YidC/Oxa1 family membrane protein insertase